MAIRWLAIIVRPEEGEQSVSVTSLSSRSEVGERLGPTVFDAKHPRERPPLEKLGKLSGEAHAVRRVGERDVELALVQILDKLQGIGAFDSERPGLGSQLGDVALEHTESRG